MGGDTMKLIYSRALTYGRLVNPARRKNAEMHKPVKTMCNHDVPFLACLAVVVGGEFKRAVRLAL